MIKHNLKCSDKNIDKNKIILPIIQTRYVNLSE